LFALDVKELTSRLTRVSGALASNGAGMLAVKVDMVKILNNFFI